MCFSYHFVCQDLQTISLPMRIRTVFVICSNWVAISCPRINATASLCVSLKTSVSILRYFLSSVDLIRYRHNSVYELCDRIELVFFLSSRIYQLLQLLVKETTVCISAGHVNHIWVDGYYKEIEDGWILDVSHTFYFLS